MKLKQYKNMQYASEPRLAELPQVSKHLYIGSEGDTYKVSYEDKLLVNKYIECPISFSTDFTVEEVLCSIEVEDWLVRILGYHKVYKWELDV